MDKTQFAPRNAVINRIETMLKNKAFTMTGGYHPYTGYTNHPLILAMQSKLNNHFTPKTFIRAPNIHAVQIEKGRNNKKVVGAMKNDRLVANMHTPYTSEYGSGKTKEGGVKLETEKHQRRFISYNHVKKGSTLPTKTQKAVKHKVIVTTVPPTLTMFQTYPPFKPTTDVINRDFGNKYPWVKYHNQSTATNNTQYDIKVTSMNTSYTGESEAVTVLLNGTEVLPPMSLALKSVPQEQEGEGNKTMTNGGIVNSCTIAFVTFYGFTILSFHIG